MPPVALIGLILELIIEGRKVYSDIREEAKRNGEWTPEIAAQFAAREEKAFASDAWKPEPEEV